MECGSVALFMHLCGNGRVPMRKPTTNEETGGVTDIQIPGQLAELKLDATENQCELPVNFTDGEFNCHMVYGLM